jgi:CheY-like chemotaxis protein
MVGTPHYMSPEQALGRPTDARSDVYSIGVMGYEMLTGKVPFDGESPLVIAMKHVSEPIPDELPRFPDVSPDFQAILLRALAKDPASRFPSAAEFETELAMLRPFAAPSGAAIPVPGPAAPPIPTPWEPTPASPPAAAPVPGAPAETPPAKPFSISSASIPAVSATPTAARAAPAPPKKTRPPVVLVVDEDARERRQLADAVSKYGCEIFEVPSGEKALDLLLREDVDLVLMSAVLPGMDGFDVTRVLKSQPATTDLPVVLVSTRLDRGHFAFAIQSGATDFLLKPVKTEMLVGRLWHILEHHGFVPPAENQSIIAAMKKTLLDAVTLTPPSIPQKK